ncbi:PsaJ protein [Calothrix membranacea FACHB-236]|nr:PsaJ protein [Calothrix membranacea FACHB-236]MBD2211638.1 PsaJ protein [Nostoc linckia FACHB-104]
MQKSNDQSRYFQRYLSLAPVLAVLTISIAFSTWAIFNFIFPDLLFHPMP